MTTRLKSNTYNNSNSNFIIKKTRYPNFSVIDYRIGTYSTFRKAMIDSISDQPHLKNWTDKNVPESAKKDYGIVLIEMWAYLCDILSYYQERIANETFIRTALLDESIIEMFYLIDYKPLLGTSASTVLRFSVNEGMVTTIPKGFRVQSKLPSAQGPVVFEVDEPVTVSSDGNLMHIDGWKSAPALKGKKTVQLDRVYKEIKEGNLLLITDIDQLNQEIVKITKKEDKNGQTTQITWDKELVNDYPPDRAKIYRFTQSLRAFGYNAPPPKVAKLRGTLFLQSTNAAGGQGKQQQQKPQPNTLVELADLAGNLVQDTTSDENGRFSFKEIFPGPYKLRIKKVIGSLELPQALINIISSPSNIFYTETAVIQLLPGFESILDVTAYITPEDQKFGQIIDMLKSTFQKIAKDLGVQEGSNPFANLGKIKRDELIIKLTYNFKGIEQFDIIGQDTLTSTIYLDKIYDNISEDSLVFLLKEPVITTLLDGSKQCFRIKQITNEFHAQFGIGANVTKLSLDVTGDNKIIENEKYGIRDTLILINPTEELKLTRNVPSSNNIFSSNNGSSGDTDLSNRSTLVFEGVHPNLKRGSLLTITDNTSSIQGIMLDKNLRPLTSYIVKIYRVDKGNGTVSTKKNISLVSSIMVANHQEQEQYQQQDSSHFVFNGLTMGSYRLAIFVTTQDYWSKFATAILEDTASQAMVRKAVDQLANKQRRILGDANIKEEKQEAISYTYSLLLELANQVKETVQEDKFDWGHLDTTTYASIQETINDIDQLSNFTLAAKQEDTQEARNRACDQLIKKARDLQAKVQDNLDITSMIKGESSLALAKKSEQVLSFLKTMYETLTLIKNILKSPFQDEKTNYILGFTNDLSLDNNMLLKVTINHHSGPDTTFVVSSPSVFSNLEQVWISNVAFEQGKSYVTVDPPLAKNYIKGLVELYSNTISASHGQTIRNEILGSGNASLPLQQFTLKQSPLSYIFSPLSPRGIKSTLEVMVNEIKWEEKQDLMSSLPTDMHYTTSIGQNGVTITFGDGIKGSTLPTGVNNVHATYRIGLGPAGNLNPDNLTVLLDNNPAIKSVTNPVSGFGGSQKLFSHQKSNALVYVKTLDRAVSIEDYANLALSFSDVAKAKAFPSIDDNNQQGIKLVVAMLHGDILVPPDEASKKKIREYMNDRRDTNIPLRIEQFAYIPVDISIRIKIKDNYLQSKVSAAVKAALGPGSNNEDGGYNLFAVEQLDFGQSISLSDVYNTITSVEGVEFAIVARFCTRNSDSVLNDQIVPKEYEILQCQNDPLDPSKGTIEIKATGGVVE